MQWLVNTPDCWGDPVCGTSPFTGQFGRQRWLDAMRGTVASATSTVDVTSMLPFPDGSVQTAFIDGLRQTMEAGNRPLVRVLFGAPPFMGGAGDFTEAVTDGLGPLADDLTMAVGDYDSSFPVSWNHSKMVLVDGQRAVVIAVIGSRAEVLRAHPGGGSRHDGRIVASVPVRLAASFPHHGSTNRRQRARIRVTLEDRAGGRLASAARESPVSPFDAGRPQELHVVLPHAAGPRLRGMRSVRARITVKHVGRPGVVRTTATLPVRTLGRAETVARSALLSLRPLPHRRP